MEAFTRGLAVDLKPLRVNIVAPGAIATELWEGIPSQITDSFKKMALAGELGRPEDTAEAYIYAMKDSYVTGTTLYSDGGWRLAGPGA